MRACGKLEAIKCALNGSLNGYLNGTSIDGTHTATYAHIWVPIYAHIRQTPIRSYSHTKVDDPGGGADDNVPGGGSWVHQHQPSILLSMNWTTPAVGTDNDPGGGSITSADADSALV